MEQDGMNLTSMTVNAVPRELPHWCKYCDNVFECGNYYCCAEKVPLLELIFLGPVHVAFDDTCDKWDLAAHLRKKTQKQR